MTKEIAVAIKYSIAFFLRHKSLGAGKQAPTGRGHLEWRPRRESGGRAGALCLESGCDQTVHRVLRGQHPQRQHRRAYLHAVREFATWCSLQGFHEIVDIEPLHVAGYIEQLATRLAKPSVKQHLAAIRILFDWLVVGQVMAELFARFRPSITVVYRPIIKTYLCLRQSPHHIVFSRHARIRYCTNM